MFDFLLGNDLLSGIVGFVLVLIPAVLIHELGHFLAAKAVGITILEFGIGLPPRMARLFTHNGTEYTLNWLPLGGFVRPLGEDIVRPTGEAAMNEDRREAEARGIQNLKSVNEAKPLGRIFFMAGGALANFLLAMVLFGVVALIGLPEPVGGRVIVVDVAPGSPLAESGLREGDVIERVNGELFPDSIALVERLYAAGNETVTLDVLRGESAETVTTEQVAFTPALEGARDEVTHPVILGVAENSPAAQAGIETGDLVTAFNGEPLPNFEALRTQTQANLGREVVLTMLRDGETFEARLTPRENPPEGEGALGIASTEVPVVVDNVSGLLYQEGPQQQEIVPQSLGEAAQYSVMQTGGVIGTIFSVPAQVIRGTLEPEAARPVSVVGIGQMSGHFLQQSVQQNQPTIILNFIAVISIALGVTNLLPLPALDGGRIFFVLLEIVRGRPIAPEREGLVHLIGLALLLSAMVVLMFNDIINPVTNMLR